MTWVWVLGTVWLIASVTVGLLLGRSIRLADQKAARGPFAQDRQDGEPLSHRPRRRGGRAPQYGTPVQRGASAEAARPAAGSTTSMVFASAVRRSGHAVGSARRGAAPASTANKKPTPASASPVSSTNVADAVHAVPTTPERAESPTEAPA